MRPKNTVARSVRRRRPAWPLSIAADTSLISAAISFCRSLNSMKRWVSVPDGPHSPAERCSGGTRSISVIRSSSAASISWFSLLQLLEQREMRLEVAH